MIFDYKNQLLHRIIGVIFLTFVLTLLLLLVNEPTLATIHRCMDLSINFQIRQNRSNLEKHCSIVPWRRNSNESDSFFPSTKWQKEGGDLFELVRHGETDKIKTLLEKGTRVNIKDVTGITPLMLALTRDDPEIAKLLIRYGANTFDADIDGGSVLMRAVSNGHLDIVKDIISKSGPINAQTESGYTALMLAAENGFLRITKLLLENGGDVNIRNIRGETSLMLAADYPDVIWALINAKADVNAVTNRNKTALMFAASEGQIEKVKILLNKGAKKDVKTVDGYTALSLAVASEEHSIVDILKNDSLPPYGKTVEPDVKTHKQSITLVVENNKQHQSIQADAVFLPIRVKNGFSLLGRLVVYLPEDARRKLTDLFKMPESSLSSQLEMNNLAAKLDLERICLPIFLETQSLKLNISGVDFSLAPTIFQLSESNREINGKICRWITYRDSLRESQGLIRYINTIIKRAEA